jgi:RHS repeat-associated protein
MLAELGLTGTPGRFTYNGNEFDDEYGFDLYYYGARYMDPALGRFTTPDPVKDFINPYSYVRNNPMNRIDPTGTRTFPNILPAGPFIISFSHPPDLNDKETFFDTLSKSDIIQDAINDAWKLTWKMSTSGNKDADMWGEISDWIMKELIENENYSICSTEEWNIVNPDNPISKESKATYVHAFDKEETGLLSWGHTVFNTDNISSSMPPGHLETYIVGEATHGVFAAKTNLLKDFYVYMPNKAKADINMENNYRREAESYSWSAMKIFWDYNFAASVKKSDYPGYSTWFKLMGWDIDKILRKLKIR